MCLLRVYGDRVVTTRMQTGRETTKKDDIELGKTAKPKHKGIFQVVQEIYQEGGLKAFWNGLVPSLILVINPALQYMVRATSRPPSSPLEWRLVVVGRLLIFSLSPPPLSV